MLIADAALPALRERRALLGVADESAHAAMGVLLAGKHPAETVAASLALDADHVPSELFGDRRLFPGPGTRPFPHCLLTVALAAAAGRRAAATGLLGHLARDMADPTTGVSLLWPLTARPFALRPGLYHAAVGALAAR